MYRYTTTLDGMRRYTFTRLYLPTMEYSTGETDARDDCEALKLMNDYNRQRPGMWHYYL